MEKQNVTLSLPKTLLKRAKTLAVQEETSLNELVRKCLEDRLNNTTGYAEARERQLRLLDSGLDLGANGSIPVAREDLHERR